MAAVAIALVGEQIHQCTRAALVRLLPGYRFPSLEFLGGVLLRLDVLTALGYWTIVHAMLSELSVV